MIVFKISKKIILKLEDGETVIYIGGERFIQCKYLLIDIPVNNNSLSEGIDSIDELTNKLDHSLEPVTDKYGEVKRNNKISTETEFFGHCSNIQAWYENSYDTRLLDKRLSFPILKKLTEIGDGLAKIALKEEIVKRIESEYIPTIEYLLNEGYLEYLNDKELVNLFQDLGCKFYDILEQLIIANAKFILKNNYVKTKLGFLEKLPVSFLKNVLREIYKKGDLYVIFYFAYNDFFNLFDKEALLDETELDLIQKITEMILSFDNTGGLLEFLKSSEKFPLIIKSLYQTGGPGVFYFLDHGGYSGFISRENYYRYLLVNKEAEAMIELEKTLKEKYWLSYDQSSLSENGFIVKNKLVVELVINSNLSDLPNPIDNLDNLKKLYLFMPNLKIPKTKFKKLSARLDLFEYELKNK